MNFGPTPIARGGSGAEAPPLAAHAMRGRPAESVKTVHNVCELACILGLTSSNNQVSLTNKKRCVQLSNNFEIVLAQVLFKTHSISGHRLAKPKPISIGLLHDYDVT